MVLRIWPTAVAKEVLTSDFEQHFRLIFGLELRVAYCVWRVACCVAVRCVAVRVALRAALRVALRRVACCVCVALRVA